MSLPAAATNGFPFAKAARKDSAVHVSLSSYSPVKQPGTAEVPFPVSRKAVVDASSLRLGSEAFSPSSVRSFEGASSSRKADGAPYGPVYRGAGTKLSTAKPRKFALFALHQRAGFPRIVRGEIWLAEVGSQGTGAGRRLDFLRVLAVVPAPACRPHLGHIPPTYFVPAGGVSSGVPCRQQNARRSEASATRHRRG